MIKTVIESISTQPTTLLPGLYEFKLVIEGLKGEEVVKLSKAVVSILKKYELLLLLSS